MASLDRSGSPLRVIAWPAFENHVLNPYNALLYAKLAELGARVEDFSPRKLIFGRHDIWHLHWPESILSTPQRWKAVPLAIVLRLLLRVARLKETKIVWTVHNLRSHEGFYPYVEAGLWRALLEHLDGYIALTEGGKAQALGRYPALQDRPGFVIPHGDYRSAYTDSITRTEARDRLKLPQHAQVLLSMGQLRPYKNVPRLIEQFRQLAAPEAILVVAGRPASVDVATEIVTAAGNDSRVQVHFGFVPADELQVYLRAADLMVLPYGEILNSGSAILALTFGCPVLVPDRGAMAELRQAVGPHWVQAYTGALSTETLRAALEWALTTPRSPQSTSPGGSWDAIAEQTLIAYQAILAHAGATNSMPSERQP